MNEILTGGFADTAVDSARAFRAALDALGRPGRATAIPGPVPPAPLSPAAAALLLTLADPDTAVWLAPELAPVAPWLVFHTGAPVTSERGTAAFGAGSWEALMPLEAWAQGSPDYPDRSATLIVEVPGLADGAPMTLTGPGIDGATVAAPRLPEGAAGVLAANAARYPLGVDLYLAHDSAVMGLPRSTCIAPEG